MMNFAIEEFQIVHDGSRVLAKFNLKFDGITIKNLVLRRLAPEPGVAFVQSEQGRRYHRAVVTFRTEERVEITERVCAMYSAATGDVVAPSGPLPTLPDERADADDGMSVVLRLVGAPATAPTTTGS